MGKKGIVDVYDNNTMSYICSFERTDEAILDYVASRAPFDHVRLVERESDELILTTIGDFLDQVPDQEWLANNRERLISKQMGGVTPHSVQTFDRFTRI